MTGEDTGGGGVEIVVIGSAYADAPVSLPVHPNIVLRLVLTNRGCSCQPPFGRGCGGVGGRPLPVHMLYSIQSISLLTLQVLQLADRAQTQ